MKGVAPTINLKLNQTIEIYPQILQNIGNFIR